MVYLIINWVVSVVSLLVLVTLLPSVHIGEFESALFATGIVGLISAGLGTMLKHSTSTLSLTISGTVLLLADLLLFRLSALLVPGFSMRGFAPAFAGAVVLLVLNLALLRVGPLREDPATSWMRS